MYARKSVAHVALSIRILDLTLASRDIAAKCQTHVTDALIGSDHFVILTTVNDKVVRSDPMPRKWSFTKANWKKFSQLVDTRLESDISLEELNSTITRSIITAAENTIPRTKNVGKRLIPWWNSDCQRAVRRKKAAFLKMKRTFKIDDVLAFKKSRSECRRTILNAKRRCWEAYCSTMDIKTNVKTVWRTVRALSGIYCGKTFPDLKTDDGGTISDDRSKANAIATVLAEVSSTNNYPPGFPTDEVMLDITDPEISAIYQEANDPLNRMFTLAELQCAISSRKNASPGRDSVCYPMLKKLPINSLNHLLRLFNSSWSTGTVPAAWKHSIIVPIPKNGKDPTSAKSYRPISLTSHIGKVMEVMVVNRLRWFLETHG